MYKQLAGDNETLRATQASNMRDLEEDNRHLKHEVIRYYMYKQLAGDNETLRATQASNMRDLEEDNRHLKHELRFIKTINRRYTDASVMKAWLST